MVELRGSPEGGGVGQRERVGVHQRERGGHSPEGEGGGGSARRVEEGWVSASARRRGGLRQRHEGGRRGGSPAPGGVEEGFASARRGGGGVRQEEGEWGSPRRRSGFRQQEGGGGVRQEGRGRRGFAKKVWEVSARGYDFAQRARFRQKCSPEVEVFATTVRHVSGIGLARWPDIPPHGGLAQGFLLIPVSGVDEAEDRVRAQIGEEEIGGNGRNGTFKRDMMRDGMILRHA